jgi:hypothetical protein
MDKWIEVGRLDTGQRNLYSASKDSGHFLCGYAEVEFEFF